MSSLTDQLDELDTLALNNFRRYLQIPSVHPDINYDACVKFLEAQAKELDLPCNVYTVSPGKPVVVMTWTGQEPNLPAILLNSHMDVVPVYEEKWTHKPFAADIVDGNIYARGAQDMKCVAIQYLEAIRRLKQRGVVLKRTVHITFVPDEEIGGFEGMKKFVKTKEFKELNVAFAMDEGITSEDEEYILFYGERCIWQLIIHCPGQSGHGSLLFDNTAGEKVRYLLNKFFQFREQEKKKLEDNPTYSIGDVTSVNLTMLKGGVQANVVPPEFIIVIDCRIPITVDVKIWEETINQWCKEAGPGVWIEYAQKGPQIPVTKLDDSNIYWKAFKEVTDDLGLKLKKLISTGGTDIRYLRAEGLPALGFSPINNTSVLLHDNDEYLGVNMFLKGIEIYCDILTKVANIEETTSQ